MEMDTKFYDNALELCKSQLNFYQTLLDNTVKSLQSTVDGLNDRLTSLEKSVIIGKIEKS